MRHPVGTRAADDRGVLIAQITDTHIRRKGDLLHHMIHTGRELRRSITALNALVPRPAFLVATGDLVERGKASEYRRLRRFLAELRLPVYLVPGNHDDRDTLRDEFREHRYLPPKGPLC
jgi:Icc protein